MADVIGVQKKEFKFDDGNSCTGLKLFFTEKRNGVEGMAADSVFVSNAKLANCSFVPKVGDKVQIVWNRFGKVDTLLKA